MTPSLAPPTVTPGMVIRGKYRVERTIGEGGMGYVLEATHVGLGHQVAIKVLRAECKTAEIIARFEREAKIASGLPPKHIARVTDQGRTESGEPYMVMELLTGQTLQDELEMRRRIPVKEAIDLVLQASEGMAHAHAAGLVHRDLKPANLWVTPQREGSPIVKVLDFGLSKAPDDGVSSLTQTATTFGTPQYMSPEQILSAKHVEPRSDQHALAAILFELITGKPVYDADSLTALAVMIATKEPARPSSLRPEVIPEVDEAILRALSKKPEDRYPDLGAFAAALAPYGGATAAETARSVAAALAPKPVVVDQDAPTRLYQEGSARPPEGQRAGAPVARTLVEPDEPLPPLGAQTTLPDPGRRSSRKLVLIGGVVAAIVCCVIAVLWIRGSIGDEGPEYAPATAAEPPPPPPEPGHPAATFPAKDAPAPPSPRQRRKRRHR